MSKREYALSLRDNKKYNCCQAVACAFAEETGIPEEILFKACEGFGAGMGCMEGPCGALAGAVVLNGMMNSDGNLDNPATKGATQKISKELLAAFKEKCGAVLCKDLKGTETGKALCSCPDCIMNGAEIVEKILLKK